MYLSARIWQFFFGFLAHIIRSGGRLDSNNHDENEKPLKLRKVIYSIVLTLLLIVLLCGVRPEFMAKHQINRFLAIFLATYIVTESNQFPLVMENKLMVLLGDVSYSVYLVHWPLITWYRYTNMDGTNELTLFAGLSLLITSIILGYFVEKAFRFILKYITNWSWLLFAIVLGYLICGALLWRLENNKFDLEKELKSTERLKGMDPFSLPLEIEPNEELELYGNFTKEQILKHYNSAITNVGASFSYCLDKKTELQTNYKFNWTSYHVKESCFAKGNGKKNIVIIGNSHVTFNYPGIEKVFRPYYKTLSVDMHHYCIPADQRFQMRRRSMAEKQECVRFVNDIIPTLKQWKEPIDILIAFFPLVFMPNVPINGSIQEDTFFLQLQSFYQQLNEIPREVLIVEGSVPYFTDSIHQVFMSKVKSGQDYMKIGESLESVMTHVSYLDKRMRTLDCGRKCLKIHFLDYWCKNKENFCPGIDPKSGLIYFVDWNHPAPLGAKRQAEYMLGEYKKFMGIRTG